MNDLLDFSKIEAGEFQLDCRDFDLLEVLESVRRLFQAQAKEKGLTLSVQVPDHASMWLRGDALRLRSILANLLSNAIKFTECGQVRLNVTEGRRDAGGVQLRFEVDDTGIGIPEDQLPRLFQPFVQADPSTARRFGGTGLGLAICKRIVAAMAGEMGVASVPGRGSTFWFTVTMPPGRCLPTAIGEAAPAAEAASVRPLSILLVDDHELNRELLCQILQGAGHRVSSANDGEIAVGMVRDGAFDVVFMDMHMPGLDGLAATRLLRSLPNGKGRIPVVALTADAMPAMRDQAMRLGFDAFLTKPIGLDDLTDCLRRAVPAPRCDQDDDPVTPMPSGEDGCPDASRRGVDCGHARQ